jgi:hypothetical protein
MVMASTAPNPLQVQPGLSSNSDELDVPSSDEI